MEVLDYARSFVTFVTPGRANCARIQVESRCLLTRGDGRTEDILLVASCKAEDTYAASRLFRAPSYDFCGLFTAERHRLIRTGLTHGSAPDDGGPNVPRFDEVRLEPRLASHGRVCKSPSEIVDATLAGLPLVGRTELRGENGAAIAVLEYPIKTMNVHESGERCQIDTGPVAVPGAEGWAGDLERFDLAFIAWNEPTWAELVRRRPTAVGAGGALVDFYGEIEVVSSRNQIVALD